MTDAGWRMQRHVEMCIKLHTYGRFLTLRQREMMRLHYDEDLSLAEISENMGISRQAVHDAIRRGEKKLDYMENMMRSAEEDDGI